MQRERERESFDEKLKIHNKKKVFNELPSLSFHQIMFFNALFSETQKKNFNSIFDSRVGV